MLIRWKFANGETSELEVDDEIGAIIAESRKKEHAANERERYHRAYSLDAFEDRKETIHSDSDPQAEIERKELRKRLDAALATLTETQRRRFLMFTDGVSVAEIARREGVSFNGAKKSVEGAKEQLKKYLDNN